MNKKNISIYTYGSANQRSSIGGIGVILKYLDQEKVIFEGYKNTTYKRMKLEAVIKGLEAVKGYGHNIHLFTDSDQIATPINNGILKKWQRNGWTRLSTSNFYLGEGAPIQNVDLWKRIIELLEYHNVNHVNIIWQFTEIEHTLQLERCRKLAKKAQTEKAVETLERHQMTLWKHM